MQLQSSELPSYKPPAVIEKHIFCFAHDEIYFTQSDAVSTRLRLCHDTFRRSTRLSQYSTLTDLD